MLSHSKRDNVFKSCSMLRELTLSQSEENWFKQKRNSFPSSKVKWWKHQTNIHYKLTNEGTHVYNNRHQICSISESIYFYILDILKNNCVKISKLIRAHIQSFIICQPVFSNDCISLNFCSAALPLEHCQLLTRIHYLQQK